MSSTNRGTPRKPADFYPTAAWVVDRLLDRLHLPGGRWLEPAAGDGAIIRAVNARRPDVLWTACELRAECTVPLLASGVEPVIGDFLAQGFFDPTVFEVSLSNPPYSLAEAFIERALSLARIVAVPLRLNFMGSENRAGFRSRVGVPDLYVLPNRPDFSGEGGDSCEYAWFVWRAGQPQLRGSVEVLDLTPRAIRVAQKPGRSA